MRRGWRRSLVLLAIAVSLAAAGAGSLAHAADVASAAFPGKNGLIAFNSDGSVYVVKPDGSDLRQVTQTGIQDGYPGVSFSPDGKLIAFSAMSTTDPDIYTVRPDGSGPQGAHVLAWCRRRPDLVG